jgi:hypothetical protein
MPYTRNFGMRSFENVVRAARFRVPTTGDQFLIGTAVQLDSANPGFLKRPDAGQNPDATCGVVVYEHITRTGDPFTTTALDFELVPAGQYAQVMRGPGVKVWFKNTSEALSYDGKVRAGVDLVDLTGVSVGDGITVTADGTYVAVDTDEAPWFIVEQVTDDGIEARFTF